MAEGEWRPNLNVGQRIVGSARGLACSTFSGVAGIEAELRDPLNNVSSGKRIAGPQTSGIPAAGDVSKLTQRRSSGTVTSSFRSRIGSERLRQQDVEFQQFADQMQAVEGESFVQPSYEALLRGQKYEWDGDAFKRSRSRESFSNEAFADHDSNLSSHGYEDGLSRVQQALERQFNFYQMAMPDQQRQAERSMMQKAWERSASKANQRLSQVEGHLAGGLYSLLQTQSRRQTELFGDEQIPRSDFPPQSDLMHITHEQPINYQPRQEALDHKQEEKDQSILSGEWFHCPYEECHRRLAMQNSSLGLSIHQRCCVHKGCSYVSPNIPEWIEHCASEHHVPAQQPQVYHNPQHEASCKYCQGHKVDRAILPIDYRFITEDRCCCPSI